MLRAWLPKRIGLLGGSFNPAHQGHRAISLFALRSCGLDQVWWLVTPHHPLKGVHDVPSLAERLAQARAIADHPRLKVTDLEHTLRTHFTFDTLIRLTYRFPQTRFVWLMGADNLCEINRWKRWEDIFRRSRIVVLRRYPYSLRSFSNCAARRFAYCRLPTRAARLLTRRKPPVWIMLMNRFHAVSSTWVRDKKAKDG